MESSGEFFNNCDGRVGGENLRISAAI